MQTGADDLVTSQCTSPYSIFCWREKIDAFTLASTDLHVFLSREYKAYSNFNKAWAANAGDEKERERLLEESARAKARSEDILEVMHKFMWDEDQGLCTSTTKSEVFVERRVMHLNSSLLDWPTIP